MGVDLPLPLDVERGDLESWSERAGGWFEQAYRYMRALGFRPNPAFICAWLSVGKDDRGSLKTFADLAAELGIARQTVYANIAKHRLHEWAEQLRLLRMRGERLAEVDERTYGEAVGAESTPAARRLYYERAGVLKAPAQPMEEAGRLDAWLAQLREASGEEED